jgi:hypothetical protein
MLTVDLSCHSLLLVKLIEAFTFLPKDAVWLGCPNLSTWLGIFNYPCVHTLLRSGLLIIHTQQDRRHPHICKNHIDHGISEGWLDLLFMTSSVRHKRDGKKVYTYVPSWSNPLANVQWYSNTLWPLLHRLIHTYIHILCRLIRENEKKPSDKYILFARAICTELTLYNIWGIFKRVANTVWTPNERCQ